MSQCKTETGCSAIPAVSEAVQTKCSAIMRQVDYHAEHWLGDRGQVERVQAEWRAVVTEDGAGHVASPSLPRPRVHAVTSFQRVLFGSLFLRSGCRGIKEEGCIS
eukprot:2331574-Rhodomonas_salina.2